MAKVYGVVQCERQGLPEYGMEKNFGGMCGIARDFAWNVVESDRMRKMEPRNTRTTRKKGKWESGTGWEWSRTRMSSLPSLLLRLRRGGVEGMGNPGTGRHCRINFGGMCGIARVFAWNVVECGAVKSRSIIGWLSVMDDATLSGLSRVWGGYPG